MANLAQLVNVIAPIRCEPGGAAWRQPTYFPFVDAAHHARGRVVMPDIEAHTLDTPRYGAVPAIASVATIDENRLALFAVNRSLTEATTVSFSAPGRVISAHILTGVDGDVRATNGPDAEPVAPREIAVESAGGTHTLTLPPVGWACVRVELDSPALDSAAGDAL